MGIPYGKQFISAEDIAAVTETLQADFLTQGPKIAEFEQSFANYCGAQYAVAVSNGTAALHLAVLALGIQSDEYVITTPITFAASANCVEYCGGNLLFADINPDTLLIDETSIRKVFEAYPDKKIVGIIPVNFAGKVANLEAIRALADEKKCWIIEDACHSPGGYFIDDKQEKQLAGNGLFADASVFSFHPVKHIATGEGGMITTNSKKLYEHLLQLRTHGITRNCDEFQHSIELASGNSHSTYDTYPAWYMEMQHLGFNYRITDFQAALGIAQLNRANQGLEKRKLIAQKYFAALIDCQGIEYIPAYDEGNAYHLFVIQVKNRRGLYEYLRTKEIYAQIHYFPVHLMPYYLQKGWKLGDFPHAESYYSNCISIPMYPTLSIEDQDFVINTIKTYYEQ